MPKKQVTYVLQKRKQQKYIKGYAILCAVLLMFFGFYTYKNWSTYSDVKEAGEKSAQYISGLRNEVVAEQSSYEVGRDEFDNLNRQIEDNVEEIFPVTDEYTALTREFDDYEAELSTRTSVFDVASINYEPIISAENYSILPARLNIRSSASNFRKFLHLIENSGALDGESRLMDISSIRLSFEQDDDENVADEIINFTVQINAYFQ